MVGKQAVPSYLAAANKREVFFSGTTALKKGMGLCYDAANITNYAATLPTGERYYNVVLPTAALNRNFAGTCADNYDASANGQFITINEPGGVAEVLVLESTTINSNKRLNCCINGTGTGCGWFGAPGGGAHPGRGAAKPLQTSNTPTTSTSDPAPVSSSLDGTATYVAATKTLTKTAAFTNAKVGDYINVVGGAKASDGTNKNTRGLVKIVTRTDADNVVVDTAINSVDSVVCFYCVRSFPTILCYLEDGRESGLIEFIDVSTGGTTSCMVGGLTVFTCGGITIAADDVPVLAVATDVGLRKTFEGMGTLTTGNALVTPTTTTALKQDGTTTLASTEIDAASERTTLEWLGSKWTCIQNVGATLA